MRIETLEIAGLGSALEALRLPFGKECRSAFTFKSNKDKDGSDFTFNTDSQIVINEKDLDLMQSLIHRGDEHAKVLRGVMVWFKIDAERFFHVELDTYRVGAERLSSESTMHIQCKRMAEEELVKTKSELTEGTMQKRVWMMSYQTLRRVYFQRRNHRLPQWRQFCKWIESLPFAYDLITCVDRNRQNAYKILKDMQNWRRGNPPYDKDGSTMPFSPVTYGQAIDIAIRMLEERI